MQFITREPTALAVKELRKAFPDEVLSTAGVISYAQIEEVVGFKRDTSHFKSAVRMWRRQVEEESRIVIGCKAGEGFFCADDRDKLQMSINKVRSAMKAASRSKRIGELINRFALSPEEQKRLDHTSRMNGSILAICRTKKQTELPTLA